MRISPVLLLLPVLVLSGSSVIANDDRSASPQPTIASPVTEPLTIESLAGTYKAVIDEKALKKLSSDLKKQISSESKKHGANVPVELEWFEDNLRQPYERMRIIINADGTFEDSFIAGTSYGKVKIDGGRLVFTTDTTRLMDGVDGSTNSPKCSECCTFTLNVSTDRKTLLLDESSNPSQLLRGYVKQ
ncbi:MAG: hypothetical protein ACAF41_20170 [Leptolyngbya sp. BL-A-14]